MNYLNWFFFLYQVYFKMSLGTVSTGFFLRRFWAAKSSVQVKDENAPQCPVHQWFIYCQNCYQIHFKNSTWVLMKSPNVWYCTLKMCILIRIHIFTVKFQASVCQWIKLCFFKINMKSSIPIISLKFECCVVKNTIFFNVICTFTLLTW